MHLRIVSLHVPWPDHWSFKAWGAWLKLSSETAEIHASGKWPIKNNGVDFNAVIKSTLGGGEQTEAEQEWEECFSRASPIFLANGRTVVFRRYYEVVSCVRNFSLSPPGSHLPFNTHVKCQLFQESCQPCSPPIYPGLVCPHPSLRWPSLSEPSPFQRLQQAGSLRPSPQGSWLQRAPSEGLSTSLLLCAGPVYPTMAWGVRPLVPLWNDLY